MITMVSSTVELTKVFVMVQCKPCKKYHDGMKLLNALKVYCFYKQTSCCLYLWLPLFFNVLSEKDIDSLLCSFQFLSFE